MAEPHRPPGHHKAAQLLAQLPISVWTTGQHTARGQRHGRYLPGSVKHPARMLPAIAAHATRVYTHPGQVVLDPMCGIGTTLVEAVHHGRHAIGVELEPHWAHLARANLDHAASHGAGGTSLVIQGDATRLPELMPGEVHGHVSAVVTSPPYGPTVHGHVKPGPDGVHKTDHHYSEHKNRRNLAHRNWYGLIDGLVHILTGCTRLLHPGGVVVVTARPWRRHGQLVDLPSAVITAGTRAGLTPTERCVALLAAVRGNRLVARPSFFQLQQIRKAHLSGTPLHLIAHEDVLVLQHQPTHLPGNH